MAVAFESPTSEHATGTKHQHINPKNNTQEYTSIKPIALAYLYLKQNVETEIGKIIDSCTKTGAWMIGREFRSPVSTNGNEWK